MVERLSCIAGPNLELDEAAGMIQNICSKEQDHCLAIRFNATTGAYGAFLGCNVTEQASWALSRFGARDNKDTSTCSSMNGTIQRPTPPNLQASDCAVLLEQAGPEGTGLVTFIPAALSRSNSTANGKKTSPAMQVGVAFGAILIVLLVAFFILFRRARRNIKRKSVEVQEFQKSELEDNSEKLRLERVERMLQLDSLQRHELGDKAEVQQRSELENNERAELGSEGERYELPSAREELAELEDRSSDMVKGRTR
jgi:hypothetical protein